MKVRVRVMRMGHVYFWLVLFRIAYTAYKEAFPIKNLWCKFLFSDIDSGKLATVRLLPTCAKVLNIIITTFKFYNVCVTRRTLFKKCPSHAPNQHNEDSFVQILRFFLYQHKEPCSARRQINYV